MILHTIQTTTTIRTRIKLMPAVISLLITVAVSINKAIAQSDVLSDWRVPPPLPPGNLTKGNNTGKEAKSKSITLSFTDVLVPLQPTISSVRLPALADISTILAAVDVPGQPIISDSETGLPEIPLPDGPDAPALPKKTQVDAPTPIIIDLPVPAAPEMPPIPIEPASVGQTKGEKGTVPITPDVGSQPPPSLPHQDNFATWPTLGIPENENINTGGKARSKGK
jgi:hypothetical protein